jgi:hypothetical protein
VSERDKRDGFSWFVWLAIFYLAVRVGCVDADVNKIQKTLNIPAEPEKDEAK